MFEKSEKQSINSYEKTTSIPCFTSGNKPEPPQPEQRTGIF
jgi:hypothetical protein